MCSRRVVSFSLQRTRSCLRYISSHSFTEMATRTYEEAITLLNSLQPSAQVAAVRKKTNAGRPAMNNIPEMRTLTHNAGITMEMLDSLSVIHVSGTKGKGSTCAFTESILRHAGYRTGFLSSPHLIEVRERIRLNGRPVSKELFTKYFFDCWDNLQATREDLYSQMKAYTKFMTLMAYHVFLKEKVDVAVVEVGLGGAYDSTNIIRNPVVCGVTLLGMDHVETLGGSLESIAWHKAGIFKPGVPAFTVEQEESAFQVLKERAKEINICLQVVPRLESYPGETPVLSLDGKHQQVNASLALQLAHTWLEHKDKETTNKKTSQNNNQLIADTFDITDEIRKGLSSAVWMGRTQTIKRPNITFYLDAAHTPNSIQACVEWFRERADKEKEQINGTVGRVLLFNIIGQREPHSLLSLLMNVKFDHAVFAPNIVDLGRQDNSDSTNFMVSRDSQLQCCIENQRAWIALQGGSDENHATQQSHAKSSIFPCVAQAMSWIAAGRDPLIPIIHSKELDPPECIVKSSHLQVLVVGSIRLLGAVMKVLGTEITGQM